MSYLAGSEFSQTIIACSLKPFGSPKNLPWAIVFLTILEPKTIKPPAAWDVVMVKKVPSLSPELFPQMILFLPGQTLHSAKAVISSVPWLGRLFDVSYCDLDQSTWVERSLEKLRSILTRLGVSNQHNLALRSTRSSSPSPSNTGTAESTITCARSHRKPFF